MPPVRHSGRGPVMRFAAVLALLVAAQFALRPLLGDPRIAPDFVLIALLFLGIRTRPAVGAAAGFLVGIAIDALAPTAFGAAALACTIIGYLAGKVKSLVFADNLLMTSLFVLIASWLRDLVQGAAANQLGAKALGWQLLVFSPLAALTTGLAALVVLLVFGRWIGIKAAA